ncbi:MAG: hypothetical protein D6820_07005 [Lentisphaerae bacterium]|nr:MAG: hypothetical protein D6820_07005 [Lentisphaerota bacterium]
MKRTLGILCCTVMFVFVCGCATGYRSEVVYQFLEGKKYKMSFKVYKITKTMFGGVKETVIYDAPNRVWEVGVPGEEQTNWGDEQSGVTARSFVPSDSKSDYSFNVEVKDKGIIRHGAKFIIKQSRK